MRITLLLLLPLLTAACGDGAPPRAPAQAGPRLVNAFPRLSFTQPVFVAQAPGDASRMFVLSQAGRVLVFANDEQAATAKTFLDIAGKVLNDGEQGLLGLAFDPGYATNGYFYLNYVAANGPRRTVIARYRVSGDPDAADPASETVLLEFAQPFANHNGGMLAFGPDGKLYIAAGDGGSANDPADNAQSLGTVLGKILRLNADGSIPGDNPFVGQSGARGEIWAFGLRNPWRFSFDRSGGALWAGDVGQNAQEEVDVITRGGNYGWRVYEGTRSNVNPTGRPASDFIAPVHTYGRDQGQSITGGYVYRGSALPDLAGAYVYGDFGSGRVWALRHDGAQAVANSPIGNVPMLSSLGEDLAGELYFCSYEGSIYKLVP